VACDLQAAVSVLSGACEGAALPTACSTHPRPRRWRGFSLAGVDAEPLVVGRPTDWPIKHTTARPV